MATYKVFFTDAGVPATGLAPTIPVLKRVDTQDDVTPPLVYEIGGGWYTFEHEPAEAQVGYVDGTVTLADADRYIPIDLNVEDIYLDAPVSVIDTNVDTALTNLATVDGIVDTIAVDVAGLDGAAMRGTDNAALATDLATVDGIVDTIAVDVAGLDGAAMRGTDSAFLAEDYTPPANPDVSRLASIPVLTEIEASTVLMKASDYTAPANPDVSRLASLPVLTEIEASTVLAKVSDLPEAPDNAGIAAIQAQTDLLPADPAGVSDIPLTADIADAVWDEATIDHTTVGSTGEAILATISAIYPSAVSIAAALWAKIITGAVSAETALATLYNGWTAGAGAGSGAGAIASEITVNVSGSPADGVEVWVSSDEAGANVVAGTLTTDAFGKVTFMLDPGSYFLFKQRSGVNFENPESIVVTL